MKTLPAAYNPFAWIYNKHWGNSFLPTALPVLDNLVLTKIPRRARILDLCCGTGQLAGTLHNMGYRVTGLDGSPAMLQYARENAPGVRFVQADARDFKTTYPFHAAFSVFDSLNHIMTLADLRKVFVCVARALRPGGLFLLDLNTVEGYEKEWLGDLTIVEDDHVCVVKNSHSPASRIATFDATIFRLMDSSWYRTDLKIYQKYHPPARVVSALKAAGFMDIEAYGFNLENGIRPLTPEMRRAFFVGRKKLQLTAETSPM